MSQVVIENPIINSPFDETIDNLKEAVALHLEGENASERSYSPSESNEGV